ncbi:hypothetical protein GCM10020255_073820 [Rhodococcus baikonurensis]
MIEVGTRERDKQIPIAGCEIDCQDLGIVRDLFGDTKGLRRCAFDLEERSRRHDGTASVGSDPRYPLRVQTLPTPGQGDRVGTDRA